MLDSLNEYYLMMLMMMKMMIGMMMAIGVPSVSIGRRIEDEQRNDRRNQRRT